MVVRFNKVLTKRIVIVLGMHRSGTSAITRGLAALGVHLGDRLHPAWTDNPKGFWEDKDCLEINEELLKSMGSAYDRLNVGTYFPADDLSVLELRVRAAEILGEKLNNGGGLWGFKDPRTCRLLPFWKPLLRATGSDLSFVICLRNPMSVARSLQKRNGIAFEKSYLLWLQHMLPALQETAGVGPRVIVEYDRLIAQPRYELERIAKSLKLNFADNETDVTSFADEFLEESLFNNRFSASDLDLDSRSPSAVRSLYGVLSKVAADEFILDGPEVAAASAEASDHLTNVRPVLSYIDRLEVEVEKEMTALSEAAAKTALLSEKTAALSTRNADLEIAAQKESTARDAVEAEVRKELFSAIARAVTLETELQNERAARDAIEVAEVVVRDELSKALARVAALESSMQSELVGRKADVAASSKIRDELSIAIARVSVLETDLQAERGRAASVEDKARSIAAKYETVSSRLFQLETSTVWRATAPLREMMSQRPRTARWMRRTAKLAWWVVTLRLIDKLRQRRQAKKAALVVLPTIPLSNTPRLLIDWLALYHGRANRTHTPIMGADALLGYFRDIGIVGDDASLFALLLQEGFDPASRKRLEENFAKVLQSNDHLAGLVRQVVASPLFDAHYYAIRMGLKADAPEAAIHYLLIGEPLGLRPSTGFDPNYYFLRNDDLRASGCSALVHFMRHGMREGRRPVPNLPSPVMGLRAADPGRENIILAIHETSRTGAPILGWNIATRLAVVYNVFTVKLAGGPLTQEFEAISVEVHGPFSEHRTNEIDAEYGLRSLFAGRTIKYAIINSIECRGLLQACTNAGVPTVLLVHEFSSSVWPYESLTKAYREANEIVFPARIVAGSALDWDCALAERSYHIFPQGMSALPGKREAVGQSNDPNVQMLSELRASGTMIVLGAGTVDMRKGVDLFMEAAAGTQRRSPARPVHFVWVGGGYRPREDLGYSLYLEEQLNRTGLAAHFTFVDAVVDLEPIYSITDVFLLSSRLDPLPNVTIDAAVRGIPVICFKNASGMADLLLAEPETNGGVVDYLDCAAAADVIVRLAGDEAARRNLAAATKQFAARTFDMDRYVAELDRLGCQAAAHAASEAAWRASANLWFDPSWYAAKYGTRRDHADYLKVGLVLGHAPGPLAAHILAKFSKESSFSPALYEKFRCISTSEQIIPLESLWLLTALYVPAWHTRDGLDGFLAYLREGLCTDAKPGPLFDAKVYWTRVGAAGLPAAEEGESAIIHWLRHGMAARIVPTDRFDEDFYRSSNPDLRDLPIWGFAHYIEHGCWEGRFPNAQFKFFRPQVATSSDIRLPPVYETWYAEDIGTRDGFSVITTEDERRLAAMLDSRWLADAYSEMRMIEPEIGAPGDVTDFLLPPHQDPLTSRHAALRARLPAMSYETIVCVPWIRTGGADLVAGLLADTLLRIRPAERLLILRTDNPHFERANWLPAAADCIDISDLTAGLAEAEAQTLLRVIFRGVAARRVFNVNSRLCWTTLRDNQASMAATHANYAYLFCWDQTPSGQRVGYPAEFFAPTAADITAFLTDTIYLKTELTAQYRLTPELQAKIIPLFTPAQSSLRSKAIAREIADSPASIPLCVFWAGRLDRQKRFELVSEIALLMPDTTFRCWGTALLDAPPDFSMLPRNVKMEGDFESFDELPLTQAGAWLFTSHWEGMPTTIIELAVRGVAVVATAVGGVPELITESSGWPLPPDAIAREYVVALRAALDNPAEAANRAEALQKLAATRHSQAIYDSALASLLRKERAL